MIRCHLQFKVWQNFLRTLIVDKMVAFENSQKNEESYDNDDPEKKELI